MLYWSFISFAVALTAGLFGFGGEASFAAGFAQMLFFVFLGVSLVLVAIKASMDHTSTVDHRSD